MQVKPKKTNVSKKNKNFAKYFLSGKAREIDKPFAGLKFSFYFLYFKN